MPDLRSSLGLLLKTVIAAIVIVAVAWHFQRLLRHPDVWQSLQQAELFWLLPAGLLYLMAHFIWGTFWIQLLWHEGAQVTWWQGLRAYFVSQFGKYIPGKAWVLLLRVGLLRSPDLSPKTVAVTATYETLTSMSAGAIIGVGLLPWVGPQIDVQWNSPRGLAFVGVGISPFVLGVFTRYLKHLPNPPLRLLFRGLVQNSVGWLCLGLSLWLVLQSLLGGSESLRRDVYLEDLAAVALSYVAGFVVLVSPGGLGAREWVLQQILTPQLQDSLGAAGAGVAVMSCLVLRLVWTLFEVIVALGLLAWGPRLDRSWFHAAVADGLRQKHDADPGVRRV